MDRALSAPGKLFLAGEYAVLWGGVARVLAVGPRVSALARQRADRVVELVLEGERLTGDSTPLGVRWRAPVSQPFHFVARTVDLALRALGGESPGFSVAFESSPLIGGHKLGLGSSARAVVLASEAVRWATGASFDALKLALLAHAEAQRGKGSGGDVAASFAGGLVRYRKYPLDGLLAAAVKGGLTSALRNAPPVDLAKLSAPGFPMVYAFSGESASTTSLVGQVEASWTQSQRQAFVTASDGLGDEVEGALRRRDFAALREALDGLQALLFSLGPTRTPALERILSLAATMGCAGKQSGAGGGDGCLLFAPDEATQRALVEAYAARGLHATAVHAEEGLAGSAGDARLAGWI